MVLWSIKFLTMQGYNLGKKPKTITCHQPIILGSPSKSFVSLLRLISLYAINLITSMSLLLYFGNGASYIEHYSPMWACSMPLEYVNLIMWAPQTIFLFFIHTLRVTLGNLGRVTLFTLFIWIIVHLYIIHWKYCS